MGLNLLIPVHVRTEEQPRDFASTYWEVLTAHGHDPKKHELGLLLPMHVGSTMAAAETRAEAGVMSYYDVIQQTRGNYAQWLKIQGQLPPERLRNNSAVERLTFHRVCSEFAAIGTVDHLVSKTAELAHATGADHVLAWMNIGTVAHDHIKESMQRFAEDALPAIREI